MINCFVNNQESVVGHLEDPDRDVGILGIVLDNIQGKLLGYLLGVRKNTPGKGKRTNWSKELKNRYYLCGSNFKSMIQSPGINF